MWNSYTKFDWSHYSTIFFVQMQYIKMVTHFLINSIFCNFFFKLEKSSQQAYRPFNVTFAVVGLEIWNRDIILMDSYNPNNILHRLEAYKRNHYAGTDCIHMLMWVASSFISLHKHFLPAENWHGAARFSENLLRFFYSRMSDRNMPVLRPFLALCYESSVSLWNLLVGISVKSEIT